VAYRRSSDKKPTAQMTCLGKIDKDSHKPIYNSKFHDWIKKHNLEPENALRNYLKNNNKDIFIDFSDNFTALNNIKQTDDIAPNNINIIHKYSVEQIQNAIKLPYGSIFLLDFISDKICFTSILNDIFLNEARKILSLAYFNILEHRKSLYCKYFDVYNISSLSPIEVTAQSIRELLNNINNNDKTNFFRLWSDKNSRSASIGKNFKTLKNFTPRKRASVFNDLKHENMSFINFYHLLYCFIFIIL
jgi:hypothetical protein